MVVKCKFTPYTSKQQSNAPWSLWLCEGLQICKYFDCYIESICPVSLIQLCSDRWRPPNMRERSLCFSPILQSLLWGVCFDYFDCETIILLRASNEPLGSFKLYIDPYKDNHFNLYWGNTGTHTGCFITHKTLHFHMSIISGIQLDFSASHNNPRCFHIWDAK